MTTNPEDVVIRRIKIADAGRARALRLEMLADTPLAFLTTLATAAAKPHAEFVRRVADAASGRTTAHFVAEAQGRLVGQVFAMASAADPDTTSLFAIYVTPAYRGRGILDALVDAAAGWSAECGRKRLELEVITTNVRACRAYQNMGFTAVGGPVPHPSIATLTEQVMVRACQ